MAAPEQACAVCGGIEIAPFAEKDGYRFARCAGCAYVFLDPMPSADDLRALYDANGDTSAEHYPKASSRLRRAMLGALRFRRYARGKRALDLGCGGGFMVEALRRVGATATGFDISPQAIAYARRWFPANDFVCSSIDDDDFSPHRFDFIYSSEVIEHVPVLAAYMSFLRRWIAPGGHVYVTTPDIGSRRVPAPVTGWDVFVPPNHVRFFNESNLARLFGDYGFAVARRVPDSKAGLKMLFRQSAERG